MPGCRGASVASHDMSLEVKVGGEARAGDEGAAGSIPGFGPGAASLLWLRRILCRKR